jgi:hypothetical protein
MSDTAKIARGLTKAQRRALIDAEVVGRGDVLVWAAHRATMKGLRKRGLCSGVDWRSCAILTPLGLAVRAHLEKSDEQ